MISPMRTDTPTIWLGRTDTMRDDDLYISGIGVHSIKGLSSMAVAKENEL
jgi:hypothetical protein